MSNFNKKYTFMNMHLQDYLGILAPLFTFLAYIWVQSSNQFKKLDEKFEKIDNRFEKLDEKIDNLRVESNNRFEKVDQKFEKLDEKIDKLRVESNNRFEKLDEKIDKLRKSDEVRDRVSRIEGQLAPTHSLVFNPSTFNQPSQKEAALAAAN